MAVLADLSAAASPISVHVRLSQLRMLLHPYAVSRVPPSGRGRGRSDKLRLYRVIIAGGPGILAGKLAAYRSLSHSSPRADADASPRLGGHGEQSHSRRASPRAPRAGADL